MLDGLDCPVVSLLTRWCAGAHFSGHRSGGQAHMLGSFIRGRGPREEEAQVRSLQIFSHWHRAP